MKQDCYQAAIFAQAYNGTGYEATVITAVMKLSFVLGGL